MRSSHALLGAMAALLASQCALADPTAFATSALLGKDAPDCGELDEACCMRAGTKCKDSSLTCTSIGGSQELRCRACGSEGLPMCDGGKCDSGLVTFGLPIPICIAASRDTKAAPVAPASAGANRRAGGAGGANPNAVYGVPGVADSLLEKLKIDNAVGKKAMRSCLDGNACERGACVGGICVACGAPGQPCCGGDKCKKLGKRAPACEYDAKLGAMICKPAAPK